MSFKKKKGGKEKGQENVSILAMNQNEKREWEREKREGRKRGTTILVKNELLNTLNIREIEIKKDREIEAIEMSINEKKYAIIAIHAEPDRDKNKKEKFFMKVENIIKNNIKNDCRILMAGDANSVWTDEDTSNPDKKDLDKTVREFCGRVG